MPREFRRITFTNSELKAALLRCGNGFEKKLHSSEIVSIATLKNDRDFLLVMELFDFSKEKDSRLEIDEGVARELLLDYCQIQKIVLPQCDEKELRLIERKVCIDMNFDSPQGLIDPTGS